MYSVGQFNYKCAMPADSTTQRSNPAFSGITKGCCAKTAAEKTKQYAKTLAFTTCLAASVACANTDSFSSSQTESNSRVSDNVTCINVKPETQEVVLNTLSEYRKNLSADKDFLKDVDVVVVDRFKNLDMSNQFYKQINSNINSRNTRGISYYSDSALKKQIVIQQNAHMNGTFFNKSVDINSLKHSLMHEVGHQFDSYFGHDHEAVFAKEWNHIITEMSTNPQKNPYAKPKEQNEIKASAIYHKFNGLSDKQQFQDAILKDLQQIATIKATNTNNLPSNLSYHVSKIDLTSGINALDVDMADFCRSEVYATLFSYANGQDDGDRESFIKCFENSYKIVQQDIETYLK